MMKSGFVFAAAAISTAISAPALAQQHAADLVRENIANGIAFTAKYSGKSISVDDYVATSSASPAGGGVGAISVSGKPDKYGFLPSSDALCVLADANEIQTFGALNKGTHIVLTGTFSSMQGSTIMMTDCSYRLSTSK